MKRILSAVIVLAVIMGFCVSAFAASPDVPNGKSPVSKPVNVQVDDGGVIALTAVSKVDLEKGTYQIIGTIPANALKTVAIDKADKLLDEEDAKAFKAAYEDAQKLKGRKVYKCYWLDIDEELAGKEFKGVGKDNALALKFTCPGDDVKFAVNGNEMDVIAGSGDSYTAIATETGAVVISCAE